MKQSLNAVTQDMLFDHIHSSDIKDCLSGIGINNLGLFHPIKILLNNLDNEKPHIRMICGYELLKELIARTQNAKQSEGLSKHGNRGHEIGAVFENMFSHELMRYGLPLITQASLLGIPEDFDGLLWNERMPVVMSLKTSLSSDRIKHIAWEAMMLKDWLLPNKFYAIYADPTGNVHNRIKRFSNKSPVNPVCATAPEFDEFIDYIKLLHQKSPFFSSIKPIMPAEGRLGF